MNFILFSCVFTGKLFRDWKRLMSAFMMNEESGVKFLGGR